MRCTPNQASIDDGATDLHEPARNEQVAFDEDDAVERNLRPQAAPDVAGLGKVNDLRLQRVPIPRQVGGVAPSIQLTLERLRGIQHDQ